MSVLLDTQAFLWWVADHPKLSRRARSAIADEHCFLSVASCWEMAIKVSLGKLDMPQPLDRFLQEQLEINGFALLPVSLEHATAVAGCRFTTAIRSTDSSRRKRVGRRSLWSRPIRCSRHTA